jgi:hypothetical protein
MQGDEQSTSQGTPVSFVLVAGNREFTFEQGGVSIFSYDLMQRIPLDAVQTLTLLDNMLFPLREEIVKAAQAQKQQEHQPQEEKTIQQRIDNLFS